MSERFSRVRRLSGLCVGTEGYSQYIPKEFLRVCMAFQTYGPHSGDGGVSAATGAASGSDARTSGIHSSNFHVNHFLQTAQPLAETSG